MEVRQKLKILAEAARYDASCASSGGKRATPKGGIGNVTGTGICHSYAPDGRCISLLKILLTNYCVYDCSYCINRVSSDVRRAKFTVGEVVDLTLDFYRRNYIEGLFLSSGVYLDAHRTMDEMVEVARQLRQTHRFGGYIHLKAVAGCSPELLERAGRWADRLSANIEMPTQADLDALAPAKTHVEAEAAMRLIDARSDEQRAARRGNRAGTNRRRPPRFAPAGQSTQMIIGATPSSDADVLRTAGHLYQSYKLRRVYYSAFSPIPHADARLPGSRPPLVREHRLYQADWLVRFYGFATDELTTAQAPNLDLTLDPKLAWAMRHRGAFPVDVNRASREQLLRVPGLGVRTVERILQARPHRALRLADIGRLRVPMARTRFFIRCADHNVALRQLDGARLASLVTEAPLQLSLFSAATTARSGEL